MASGKTFKFGSTLINISKRGIATKDTSTGEIKRYAFPWSAAPSARPEPTREQDYDDEETQYEEYDDEYPQRGAADQRYSDDGDDDYDYADDDDQPEPAGLLGSIWFMWLMLVILPPFGIWLLWKHNRFEITIRSAISAASIVWFIVMLIWLFSRVGGNDPTKPPVLPSNSPSSSISASETPGPDDITDPSTSPSNDPSTSPSNDPTNTPNGDNTSTPDTTDSSTTQFVYSIVGGANYHSNATCSNMTNASRVTLSIALSRGQTACTKCWTQATATTTAPTSTPLPSGSYYATPGGASYHLLPTCNGMKNAQVVTLADAMARNQKACPDCIGSVYMTDKGTWYHSVSNCQKMSGAKLVTVDAAVAANKTACPVCMGGTNNTGNTNNNNTTPGTTTQLNTDNSFYCTTNGKYYHKTSTCTGMKGAYKTSAAAAENNNKTACPVCLNGTSGVDSYYSTTNGDYYHTNSTCTGMKNASRVSLATALSRNQTACPTCAGGTAANIIDVDPGNAGGTAGTASDDATYYSTVDGTYFHSNNTCTGMKGATKVTAAQIAERHQTACPKCIGTSGTYYSNAGGTYYHSNSTCTGMKDADIVTLAMIRSRGQTACPKCLGGTANNNTPDDTQTGDLYYATAGGTHYHTKATCTGMKGAAKVTLATATGRGQTPCPTCIGSVYSTDDGAWYHKTSTCSGMKGAKLSTILSAEKAGKTACPVCIGGGVTPTAEPGQSDNLAYYATDNGEHYHRTSTCTGMKGANKISEAAAKAAGKTACPKCIGSVYATDNGDYYHKTSGCTGMKGAKLMTVDQAELSGKAPCPTCMGGTPIDNNGGNDGDNTGGNTGGNTDAIDVWVTIEGSKYHSEKYCSGMKNAAKTTLTWALDHNYKRCTVCDAPST